MYEYQLEMQAQLRMLIENCRLILQSQDMYIFDVFNFLFVAVDLRSDVKK